MRFAAALALTLSLLGCGDPSAAPVDAARDAPDDPCTDDSDCDDGVFCNGVERCLPDLASADARGCVASRTPCLDGQSCDEREDRCTTDCTVSRDADGDGSDAVECGGDDCDDSSERRRPGETEVCDASDVDEDCDPTTFGVRDLDGDGYADARCCNVDGEGASTCGTDCDDASTAVNPAAVDACDRAMRDEDCSGAPNDPPGGCACVDGDTQPCTAPGVCRAGIETCVGGAFSSCSISPSDETCDGEDDDCDGAVDETLRVECWPDADGDDLAPAGASSSEVCRDAVRDASPWLGCPANRVGVAPATPEATDCDDADDDVGAVIACFVDGDGDGVGGAPVSICPTPAGACPAGHVASGGDCCDTDSRARPGATTFESTARTGCGGFDFDCNGTEQIDAARDVSCGVFTVGESACTTRNTQFMGNPHYDLNMAIPCGANAPYITGCSWNGTGCVNVSAPRLVRCR